MYKNDLNYLIEILKNKKPKHKVKDWYSLFGFICSNKIAGYFYNQCKKMNIEMPSLIENLFHQIYLNQKARNNLLRKFIYKISYELEKSHIVHAFLKGSILSNCALQQNKVLYQIGERTSNDIDILIHEKDITKLENILRKLHFSQGYYDLKKNKIILFDRKEIIARRMNRGETAPWILKISNYVVPFVEIDINFSLDSTAITSTNLTNIMLSQTVCYKSKKNYYIRSLEKYHFIIQLILHAYKELTLVFMVKKNKDIQLYKFLDLYLLLSKEIDLLKLLQMSRKYSIEYEVYTIFKILYEIFDLPSFLNFTYNFPFNNKNYILNEYESKKFYIFETSTKERLLNFSNEKYLKEIANE